MDSYVPTIQEKIWAFFYSLKTKLFPRKQLIVGPFLGEFGWEIMHFQSYVNALSPIYEKVYVITYPGRSVLYPAGNMVLFPHKMDLKLAGYAYGKTSWFEINAQARLFAQQQKIENFDLFNTTLLTESTRKYIWKQRNLIFRSKLPSSVSRQIVFHFRDIDKEGSDKTRNFNKERAKELAELSFKSGYKCACIGHPKYSFCPQTCEDCRTEDLDQTVAVISSAEVVVGELSGPMHLAVYCGKPIVIWAPGAWRIEGAFRSNPHNVKIFVVTDQTTDPLPIEIKNVIDSFFLHDLSGEKRC